MLKLKNAHCMQKDNDKKIEWATRKTWDEFRSTGLLFFINSVLHVFGWAIVVEVDSESKKVTNCYPSRVKYRGFDEKTQGEEHIKIAQYLSDNANELKNDTLL